MKASEAAERIQDYAQQVKPELLRPARGILRHRYLSAGLGDTYPDLTDWDAVWAGMAYLRLGDPEPLRDSLWNLVDHMAPDGKGQRRIGFQRYSAPPYQCRPFLMSGCRALTRAIGTGWLREEDLDALDRHLLYWHVHRVGREGLLQWLHVDEGFADNGLANWAWQGMAVEAVDLNAQMVREHLSLADAPQAAGDGTRAARHRRLAGELVHRIESCLWHEQDGSYYSLYNPPERYLPSTAIKVRHYTNLWPLWIGCTPPERAKRVIEDQLLHEGEYRCPFGVRSMACSERHFNNMATGYSNPMSSAPQKGPVVQSGCSNWQGPLWPVPTWLGVMALRRYGYRQEAKRLASDYLVFLAERLNRDGAFYENYHSETGEPLHARGIGSWYLLMPALLDEDAQELFRGVGDGSTESRSP